MRPVFGIFGFLGLVSLPLAFACGGEEGSAASDSGGGGSQAGGAAVVSRPSR